MVAIRTEEAAARAIDDGGANHAMAWISQSDTRTLMTVNGRNARSNWACTVGPTNGRIGSARGPAAPISPRASTQNAAAVLSAIGIAGPP
jgi:hypothetical protein